MRVRNGAWAADRTVLLASLFVRRALRSLSVPYRIVPCTLLETDDVVVSEGRSNGIMQCAIPHFVTWDKIGGSQKCTAFRRVWYFFCPSTMHS